MSDTAQWFSPLGRCACGKPATGELKSYYGNSILDRLCQPCAERRIKKAHKLKQFEPDCVIRDRLSRELAEARCHSAATAADR